MSSPRLHPPSAWWCWTRAGGGLLELAIKLCRRYNLQVHRAVDKAPNFGELLPAWHRRGLIGERPPMQQAVDQYAVALGKGEWQDVPSHFRRQLGNWPPALACCGARWSALRDVIEAALYSLGIPRLGFWRLASRSVSVPGPGRGCAGVCAGVWAGVWAGIRRSITGSFGAMAAGAAVGWGSSGRAGRASQWHQPGILRLVASCSSRM